MISEIYFDGRSYLYQIPQHLCSIHACSSRWTGVAVLDLRRRIAVWQRGTLGENGINTPYDQISQIFTELAFQCPQALVSNDSASVGIPTWRYYFNASFINTQLYPDIGVYHASEIPIVFSTYPTANITTQEYALSNAMRGAWARFAKNPMGGPGWNPVGTGGAGPVLVGAEQLELGGIYTDATVVVVEGAWDLGLFGNRGDAMCSGITVIDQAEVDHRCELFAPLYLSVLQG